MTDERNLTPTRSLEIQPWTADLRAGLPAWVCWYAAAYLSLLFLIVFYIPGNDFDTMSSYVCRIKLEEFGPLEQTGTNELQYVLPKFFDYLHKPFLAIGYFTTLPSFLLFCAMLVILFRYHDKRLFIPFFFLVFACQPILTTCVGLKNDFALGALALLAWFGITRLKNKTWYLPLCCLLLAALIGTKWHGFALAGVLGLLMLYRAVRERLFTPATIASAVLIFPAIWYVSSGEVYLKNWVRDGRLLPQPTWLEPVRPNLVDNARRFAITSALDTIDLPGHFMDQWFNTGLYTWANEVSENTKQRHLILAPATDFTAFGGIILIVLAADLIVLARWRRFSFATRASAFTALCYFIAVVALVPFNSWRNRYYLPAYVMSIVPAAEALSAILAVRWVRVGSYACAVIVSLQCLLMPIERNLIDVRREDGSLNPSILRSLGDRDKMYFHVWKGYYDVFSYLRENVHAADSLLFINNCEPNSAPFLYPLIKNRRAANTYAFDAWQGKRPYAHLLGGYEYVMIFRGKIEDPRYEPAFLYPGPEEMNIYRLKH